MGPFFRKFLYIKFRTFLTWFRTFLTWFRTFLIWNRTFLIWIFSQSTYAYYVQKNFEGLGKTENKDYKIYYKIIIKYQILFFEFLDNF